MKFKIVNIVKEKWKTWDRFFRSKATSTLEWEYAELKHIFTLITFGHWVGLPSPPPAISLNLMPEMEDEIIDMLQRVELARSPLSQLFSYLDIG